MKKFFYLINAIACLALFYLGLDKYNNNKLNYDSFVFLTVITMLVGLYNLVSMFEKNKK
jgi:hypothetical protein